MIHLKKTVEYTTNGSKSIKEMRTAVIDENKTLKRIPVLVDNDLEADKEELTKGLIDTGKILDDDPDNANIKARSKDLEERMGGLLISEMDLNINIDIYIQAY